MSNLRFTSDKDDAYRGTTQIRGKPAEADFDEQMGLMSIGASDFLPVLGRSQPSKSPFDDSVDPDPSAELGVLKEEMKVLLAKLEDTARRKAAEEIGRIMKDILGSFPPVVLDVVEETAPSHGEPFLIAHEDGGFTLRFRDPLARQRRFKSCWAVLPSDVANLPCHETPELLVKFMNQVMGEKPELTIETDFTDALQELIDDGCDRGQVYGHLRQCWPLFWNTNMDYEGHKVSVLGRMRACKQKDHDIRASAISGNRISDTKIPPRRVWDLYSNRVLPYYVLTYPQGRPHKYDSVPLWPISHSWRPDSERQSVLTTINGKAWRVPIPRGTTLNDIRNELLILGAEYVFLDVLCLRQHDKYMPRAEAVLKKEWRLDIPTIGSIYQEATQPVIVYFNGLGLPFCDGPVDPQDQFHWANRVWTMQEHRERLIIGGLEHKSDALELDDPSTWPSTISAAFLQSTQDPRSIVRQHGLGQLCQMTRRRSFSNPVDQVASIIAFLDCTSLPIYDPDLHPDVAWDLLMDSLPAERLVELLFTDFGPETQPDGSWWPTWKQFLNCKDFKDPRPGVVVYNSYSSYERRNQEPWRLQLLDKTSQSLRPGDGLHAYYHQAYVVQGCFVKALPPPSQPNTIGTVTVPLRDDGKYGLLKFSNWGTSIRKDAEYTLVSLFDLKYWVVAELKGTRKIDKYRTALSVAKVGTITAAQPIDGNRDIRGFLELVIWC